MKQKRKIRVCAAVFVLAVVCLLGGCGGSKKIDKNMVGKWETILTEEEKAAGDYDFITLELRADGTASAKLNQEETTEGNWAKLEEGEYKGGYAFKSDEASIVMEPQEDGSLLVSYVESESHNLFVTPCSKVE